MALGGAASQGLAVEVYLTSTIIRGTLATKHDRLSDHLLLRASDELFSLKDAAVEDLHGQPLSVGGAEYFIHMREALFIADLNTGRGPARSNLDHAKIAKESKNAVILVSPFWIRGQVHLMPGAALQDLLALKNRFIPVTGATLIGRSDVKPRTLLVNRTKVGCLAAAD